MVVVFRRPRRQARRRPGADRQAGHLRLHDARAGRRRGRAHRVELAALVRRLEMRRGAGRGLRCHRQAVGVHLGQHAGICRADERGRHSRRHVQRGDGVWARSGHRAGLASWRRQDHLHGIGHDGREGLRRRRSLKRVSLELGGKSPNIVFDDADLAAAAAGTISGIFAATGQTCIAGSRLLVQNSIKEEFVERRGARPVRAKSAIRWHRTPTSDRSPRLRSTRRSSTISTLRNRKARAVCWVASRRPAPITGGQFVEPTIFTDVDDTDADRARGSVRSGALDHRVRHRGRRHPHRQRHDLWPRGRHLDPRYRPRGAHSELRSPAPSGSTPTAPSAT